MRTHVALSLLITVASISALNTWGMEGLGSSSPETGVHLSEAAADFLQLFGSQNYQHNGRSAALDWPSFEESLAGSLAGFSPDGKLAAFDIGDGKFLVLDIKNGTGIGSFVGLQGDRTGAVIFSPDNRFLLQAGYQRLLFYSLENGATLGVDINYNPYNYGFHVNSRCIFANADSGTYVSTLEHLKDPTNVDPKYYGTFAVSSNGRVVVARMSPAVVVVVDIEQKKIIANMLNDKSTSASFSMDDRLLALASSQGVAIWDLEKKEEIVSWRMDDAISSIAFLPDGKLVIQSARANNEDNTTTVFASYCPVSFDEIESREVVISNGTLSKHLLLPAAINQALLDPVKFTYLNWLMGCYQSQNRQRFSLDTFVGYLLKMRPELLHRRVAQMEQAVFEMFTGDELSYVNAFFLDDRIVDDLVFHIFED